jgi:CHAT domain-containing protein/tetratricopeptide (TPR) repeat protein
VTLWAGCLLASQGALACPEVAAPPVRLAAGAELERAITGSECHRYWVPGPGPLWVRLEERSGDFAVAVGAPDGATFFELDGPAGPGWLETFLLEPGEDPEPVTVRLPGPAAPSASYHLSIQAAAPAVVEALRLTGTAYASQTAPAWAAAAAAWGRAGQPLEQAWALQSQAVTLRERERDHAGALEQFSAAVKLLADGGPSALHGRAVIAMALTLQAERRYAEADELLHALLGAARPGGEKIDPKVRAHALIVLGLGQHARDRLDAARTAYGAAAELLERHPEPRLEAMVQNNLAGLHYVLGEPAPAFAAFERSIAIAERTGDDAARAHVLVNAGSLHANLGQFDRALDRFTEALGIFESLGQQADVATALRGIGATYQGLGLGERAREFLVRAMVEAQAAGGGTFATRLLLGDVHRSLGDTSGALAMHAEALAEAEAAGRPRRIALAQLALGRDALAAGQPEVAEARLGKAEQRLRQLAYRRELAEALQSLGASRLAMGRLAAAWDTLEEAARLQQALADDRALAATLALQARVRREQGALRQALELADSGVTALERARGRVSNDDLRASFFGARQQPYDELLRLHLLVGVDTGRSGEAALAALAVAERARARALKERLGDGRATTPQSREARDRLLTQMNGQLMRLRGLQHAIDEADSDSTELTAKIVAVGSTLGRLRLELDALDARETPRNAVQAAMLDAPGELTGLQQRLAPGVAVLVFHLGEQDGIAWLIRKDAVEASELPAVRRIQDVAARVHELAARWDPDSRELEATLAELAEMLLNPLALPPDLQRLIIVPDGVLHQLPWGALPGPTGRRLLDEVALSTAPAVGLVGLSQFGPVPRGPELAIAVLAAPVFEPATVAWRIPAGPAAAGLAEIFLGLGPLPFSREEARRISRRASDAEVLILEGHDANKAALAGLGRYDVLHFATHAVASNDFPELSGLVLSQQDRDGRPLEGLLHLEEIYGLELEASLVVLSACRTAGGRVLRGEGPAGLARAFLLAGARRVLATQWSIPDDATVELMDRFYAGLLDEGLGPAAALQAAQRWMAGQPGREHPFYWAGFSLTDAGMH